MPIFIALLCIISGFYWTVFNSEMKKFNTILTNIDCSSVCARGRVRVHVFLWVFYYSFISLPFRILSHSLQFFCCSASMLYVFVVCARLFFVTLNSISDCITTKPYKKRAAALGVALNLRCRFTAKQKNRMLIKYDWICDFRVWIVSEINSIYVSFYRCFMLNDSEIVVVRHSVGLFVARTLSLSFSIFSQPTLALLMSSLPPPSSSSSSSLSLFYCWWYCVLPQQKLIELLKCANPKMEMNWR